MYMLQGYLIFSNNLGIQDKEKKKTTGKRKKKTRKKKKKNKML